MISLVNARATKIEVINNLIQSGEISINIIHEFNVNYAADEEHCRAVLRAGFETQGQPGTLAIICTMVGDFDISKITSDEEKKKTHVECYYKLFPYAQALVMRLCSDAGVPPLFLQPVEMKEENVIINV